MEKECYLLSRLQSSLFQLLVLLQLTMGALARSTVLVVATCFCWEGQRTAVESCCGFDELAACFVRPDGSDGCKVGFTPHKHAVGARGCSLDGALVRLLEVYTPEHPNCHCHALLTLQSWVCNCRDCIRPIQLVMCFNLFLVFRN